VVPEFELPNFSEFSYEKSESEPTDEELEQAIEHLRTQRADFQVVERAAEKGDYVQCSYTGMIGDELVSDRVADKPIYGSQETSWEEAGSEDGRISAISEAIVGMKSGDSKEVSMNYPSDFEVEALQEMEVLYSLEVSEIRAKVLPELNDEFFKSLEVESLEALKIKTREQMKSQRDYSNKMQIRKKVSEDFTASVDFELPLSGIEDQRDAHLHETMERRMSQGASQEDLEEQKETLIAESTEVAKDRLKLTLMLDKVAFANKVQAEKEDFNNAIMQEAYMNQTEPNKLIKELSKDRDRVEQLRGDIIRSKALDLIIEQATVIEAAQPEAIEA
jgi:trigger factor